LLLYSLSRLLFHLNVITVVLIVVLQITREQFVAVQSIQTVVPSECCYSSSNCGVADNAGDSLLLYSLSRLLFHLNVVTLVLIVVLQITWEQFVAVQSIQTVVPSECYYRRSNCGVADNPGAVCCCTVHPNCCSI